jgi:hypothetical protein
MDLLKYTLTVCLIAISFLAIAQDNTLVFTGIILDNDKLKPVVGSTILNQSRGGGAVSDSAGLFTIEAMKGDTLLFSDVRFVNTTLVVPVILTGSTYGIIQVLINKSVVLDAVNVYSMPSEDKFKQVFVSLDLKPTIDQRAVEAKKSLRATLREAYNDEKYYYDIWANRSIYELSHEIPPNYLLDPIRWSQFISDFRAEERKK